MLFINNKAEVLTLQYSAKYRVSGRATIGSCNVNTCTTITNDAPELVNRIFLDPPTKDDADLDSGS